MRAQPGLELRGVAERDHRGFIDVRARRHRASSGRGGSLPRCPPVAQDIEVAVVQHETDAPDPPCAALARALAHHLYLTARLSSPSSIRLAVPSGCGLERDSAGLGWTQQDMIQNMPGADQADSDCADKWRTGSGFHFAAIGGSAGQLPCRWVGMGSLENRRLSLRWFEPSTAPPGKRPVAWAVSGSRASCRWWELSI